MLSSIYLESRKVLPALQRNNFRFTRHQELADKNVNNIGNCIKINAAWKTPGKNKNTYKNNKKLICVLICTVKTERKNCYSLYHLILLSYKVNNIDLIICDNSLAHYNTTVVYSNNINNNVPSYQQTT